ncbi:MAG TPA: nicotinate phosphoribosyltransferase [Burkholderiaceae bacterium]|nr:nicotinate phosphoribosyltransferase [Burkholderiaceae bacterium]
MIIESLLDTDLYKFTMMQVVLHRFPGAQVEYRFKCRTPGVDLTADVEQIRREVRHLCSLRFAEGELDYLRGLRFIRSDFVDFLGLFHLNTKYIQIEPAGGRAGEIDVTIRGPWLHTILFEIPVLAIINETYYRRTAPAADLAEGRRRLREKIGLIRSEPALSAVRIADYGTRRRFSRAWQDEVLCTLKSDLRENLAGTSNVLYAWTRGLTPVGTMAHEYLQACQALGPRLRDSQTFGFETWAREYRGDLGIALSDVYGMDAFLRDFDLYFCKLFDGARHDSGDPAQWGERLIAHYEYNRVDPTTRTLVFSDGLTFARVVELYRRFHGRARVAFGVGTHLMNDLGHPALQIVIKMVRCNGQPVAKLTDSPEKNMCDDEAYVAYLRQVFQIPPA